MSPAVNPTAVPSVAPLRWTQAPPIVRLWAFWFTIITLFACGAAIVLGISQFSNSPNTGVFLTGGGLLLALLFSTHLVALRRGWGIGWSLQIIWAAVFLGAIALSLLLRTNFAPGVPSPTRDKVFLGFLALPALVHLWILAHWFKAEVKIWFGRLASGVASK